MFGSLPKTIRLLRRNVLNGKGQEYKQKCWEIHGETQESSGDFGGSAGSASGPLAVGIFGLEYGAGIIGAVLVACRSPECSEMIECFSVF